VAAGLFFLSFVRRGWQMDLKTTTNAAVAARPERVMLNGSTNGICIKAGKRLKIKTTGPEGEDILDVEVPEGKEWKVTVTVGIKEIVV